MLTLVPPVAKVRSNCPDCDAELAILRIIAGRAGAEYWTLRCTECGGIHLDIIKGEAPLQPAGDAASS
ncbi:MAG TPA: hypothetical protein VHW66_01410 [Stellaceae bacterium]|jgi:uncharacterized Zn finger protein|nr:hypothetical protein [Stellaceae bacterium]